MQDRAKDMVLRAGENVYCAEVEAAIYEHPDVYEAAVFGVPHERLGEEVAVAIVPKPGKTPRRRRRCAASSAQHLAPFKIPTRVAIHAEQLPRNPAGKILKRDAARRPRRRRRHSTGRNVMRRFSRAASRPFFGTSGCVSPSATGSSCQAGTPRFSSS